MESSFATGKLGARPDDLTALLREEGPFLTVYLTTEGAVPNAGQLSEKRWKALREDLSASSPEVPDAALDAVEALVGEAHLSGETLAVVAGPAGVRHVEHHPEPPRRDLARWGPLPLIGPLIEWRQQSPTHLLVLADRTGADLITVVHSGSEGLASPAGADSGAQARTETTVQPPSVAGMSQRRNHQRAENSWADNARSEADAVARLVDAHQPRLVLAAGDVRAVQMLRDAVPNQVRDIMEVIEGGRTVDGSSDDLADEVVRQVSSAVAEDTVAVLHQLRSLLGQGQATEGADAVLDALRQSQVELLILHDDPDDDRTAWFGLATGQVAMSSQELEDLGVDQPRRGRLADVVLLGALETGAAVWIVPHGGGPADDLGALLRWPTPEGVG